jgi:xanthine dehydrogenase accessory factor
VRPNAVPGQIVAGAEEQPSGCPSGGTTELFVEPILPRPSLIVLGASPCAQAVARLGVGAGYAVTLSAAAQDQARLEASGLLPEVCFLPDFQVCRAAPGAAVVVATQGKGDAAALKAALRLDSGYCAFVGSRRKADRLTESLQDDATLRPALDRLRSPAGLDIGARTPEEIALSILAELVVWRSGKAVDPALAGAQRRPGGPSKTPGPKG